MNKKFSDKGALYKKYQEMAREKPNEIAIQIEREPYKGITLTWLHLVNRSVEIESILLKSGLLPGQRYGVILSDHPDLIPLLLAIWSMNSIAVLIDEAWGDARRGNILSHSYSNCLISFSQQINIQHVDLSDARYLPLPEDTALLGYTSGSTGDPKGIPFEHTKLAYTLQAAAAAVTAHRGESVKRIGCSMRLSGSGILNLNYTWAAFAGATLVILPQLKIDNAKDYWVRISAYGIQQAFLVPSLIELLNHIASPHRQNEKVICLTGSSPLTINTQNRFQQKFELALLNAYGLSETMCTCFFGTYEEGSGYASNSIGFPWLLNARLVNSDGEIVNGDGEGELQLSGPTIFEGYYGNTEATNNAFEGSWLKTGDIVRRDNLGQYWICGRIKDVVMKGGYSVYLNEIEEAALGIPTVIEAAAIPIVLTNGAEDIGLAIRLSESAPIDITNVMQSIIADIGQQRAPAKIIQTFEALPRTGQDKLNRPKLKEFWSKLCEQA
jgi:acyl-CoA synthetase (AMP-forming)/AMP-acid ligase II